MTELVRRIRPHTKRNGSFYLLLGAGGLLLIALVHGQTELIPWPVRLCLASFCLITMALGIGKLVEPDTSLEITPDKIHYIHIRGRWTLAWDDIVRYNVPTVQYGAKRQSLAFLGIRLRHYDAFLQQLSPRLAVHLLHQQRALMTQAIRSEMPPHRQYTDYFEVPDYFVSETGKRYSGVLATFAVRMQLMRELLGYDLYIPQNAFDRPLLDFVAHLKALQQTRSQYL
ncbi:DUF2982 domain-containing protein [Aliidiomarina soli]|uniref:DUF2982 domain-containing protein n=1 Tax=Aliidiomarina soli TaxID=1928574 RepID=A0A432WC75_9GAMM|nr:DUF2982 domain-containing protein [Aliidiomarina soli]RUO29653.1 DUF2982 domain-containing protein [Aliidiomarina soli]